MDPLGCLGVESCKSFVELASFEALSSALVFFGCPYSVDYTDGRTKDIRESETREIPISICGLQKALGLLSGY